MDRRRQPDLLKTEELQAGLNSEMYRDGYQNLCSAIDQLAELGVEPEEHDQAKAILQTLYLCAIGLPENMRDGLTKRDVAEAAWLQDKAIGPAEQAEQLLEKMVQAGFPIRAEKKTRDGETVSVYSYELSSAAASPARYFAPLKKRFKEQTAVQDAKWVESLFWELQDISVEAQRELGVNGGLLTGFRPPDRRTARDQDEGKPASFEFPHPTSVSTRVHRVNYGGEAIVADRWQARLGEEIENADQHFRIVYLTGKPAAEDEARIAGELDDDRIAVCWPQALSSETRDALADLLAAEQMKRDYSAPSQEALRAYADGKRREALKAVLKGQLDEYRRGKVWTKQQYAIKSLEIFGNGGNREHELGLKLLEKAYSSPLFNPGNLKKDLTAGDGKKIYRGLFHKVPGKADRDAVTNFAVGLELARKAAPGAFDAAASAAIARIQAIRQGKGDLALSDLKSSLCRAPFALTDWLVSLYVFAMVRQGQIDLAFRPNCGVTTINGRALTDDRLTATSVQQCDWDTKMDRALLGARLIEAVHKEWDQVLPWARVVDPSLKPASSPDEEQVQGDLLLQRLALWQKDVPEIKARLTDLAGTLGEALPRELKEILLRFEALATVSSYQEFDAAIRESYPNSNAFAAAHACYERARRVHAVAFELRGSLGYLDRACPVTDAIEFQRTMLRPQFTLAEFLANPSLFEVRNQAFEKWTAAYVQAYRKAHRDYHDALSTLSEDVQRLRPRVLALRRMNGISELGPALSTTTDLDAQVRAIEQKLVVCVDRAQANVGGGEPLCPRCLWTPDRVVPRADVDRLRSSVDRGIEDRFQRFKDAAIAKVLRAAAEGNVGLKELLDIIQVADADRLAPLLTDDVVALLRKTLYDENLVDEQIPIARVLSQVGPIEAGRMDEALATIGRLLEAEILAAKSRHQGKRVRVFLTLDEADGGQPRPAAAGTAPGGDA